MITYEKPELEIIEFDNDDILLTGNSDLLNGVKGSNDVDMSSYNLTGSTK